MDWGVRFRYEAPIPLMRSVAIVVPCFNEERRLDVAAFVNARLDGWTLEFILVDDGSTDGTRRVLERIRDARSTFVTIIEQRVNRGKAEAVRTGILHALERRPFAVGFWDADLAAPLAEIANFVDVLETHPAVDVVVGARVKLMGRVIERRAWRHYLGRIFATAASVALDLPVYDTQCGAKLFRATPTTARVFAEPFLARWVFDVEIIARFLAMHADAENAIYELPLGQWTHVSGSKLHWTDFATAAVDLALIRGRHPRRR